MGRTLWPTYFQLAAMTFAWNASLATGFALLFYGQIEAGQETLLFEQMTPSNLAMRVIAIIGLIYNSGALAAYTLMNSIHRSLISSILALPDEYSGTQTAKVLEKYVRPSRFKPLKYLTHLFFVVLCLCWGVAAYLTWISG